MFNWSSSFKITSILPNINNNKSNNLERDKEMVQMNQNLITEKPITRRQIIKTVIRLILFITILLGICTFLVLFFGSENVRYGSISFINWLENVDTYLGTFLMILTYSVALLLFCPGTPFNLASGYIFGFFSWFYCFSYWLYLGSYNSFYIGKNNCKGLGEKKRWTLNQK